MTEYAFEGAKRASAAVSWSFETQTLPSDAVYPYSSPISAAYQGTIQAAFARWASVAGLSFTQVADSASAGIRIGFGVFPSTAIVGQTVVRGPNGALGDDTVIRLLDPTAEPLVASAAGPIYADYNVTLYQVAVHEIGHALGLDHSTDPATIMYPVATAQNRDLGAGDIQGMNALYPLYTVAAQNPVQVEGNAGATAYAFSVTRYSDPAAALTVAYQVSGAAYAPIAGSVAATASEFGGAFPSGQLAFAAGSSTATLTIQVPGNTGAAPDEGFAVTIGSLDPSTQAATRGSNAALILDDDGYNGGSAATQPVYRFFASGSGTHFFTGSEAERNTIITTRPDMSYEGVGLRAVANPAGDAAAIPVYRFFDSRFGTHFYTSSTAERDSIAATRSDLVAEGIAFYEDSSQQSGDAAVYRFFDASNGTHFYTGSGSERATIAATRPDLVSEGVAFYAPSAA